MKALSIQKTLSSLAVISALAAGSANAALLPLPTLDYPLIVQSEGLTSYDMTTRILSTDVFPITAQFAETEPVRPFLVEAGEYVQLRVEVGSDGSLIGGVAGDDLIIEGQLDIDGDGIIDVTGVLITAEVTGFGFLDSGNSIDQYNYSFTLTGGALAPYYATNELGLSVVSDNSNFTNFTQNFTGTSIGILGAFPQIITECTVDVVGTCTTAGSTTPQASCEIPASTANCSTLGKPTNLTFKYTGGGCDASDNAATDAGKKIPECSGTINNTQPISIATSAAIATPTSVAPGEEFTLDGLGSNTSVWLITNDGIEDNAFHTSCSTPLEVGDVFGSLTLVAFNGETGGTEVTFAYTVTNTGDTTVDSTDVSDSFGVLDDSPIGTLNTGDMATIGRTALLTGPLDNMVTATGNAGSVSCSAMAPVTITQAAPEPPTCKKGSKGSKGRTRGLGHEKHIGQGHETYQGKGLGHKDWEDRHCSSKGSKGSKGSSKGSKRII